MNDTPHANTWISRLGVYEPGRPIDEVARELGFSDHHELIKLASNENSLGVSPAAAEVMKANIAEMHLYPDGGAFYLRRGIAEQLGVSMEHVVVGNGSNELIEFLGHVFLGEGTSLVMSEQAFVVYKLIAGIFQADVIETPMTDFAHDLDAMQAAIREDTRLVFVANPNNPTGTYVDPAKLDQFIQSMPEHVLLVVDEAYYELMPPDLQPAVVDRIKEGYPVCLLRTFSKAYGLAGLRVGYAVGRPADMALLQKVRQPFNVNAMGQAAAVAALGDDQHLADTRKLLDDGLAFIGEACQRLNLEYVPSVTNFILIKTGNGRDVFRRLQREGVIVRPMDVYKLPDYVRVTVGTSEENTRFVEALEKVLS